MGIEDIFSGTVNITEEGLAELDKIAEKQEQKLKKIQAQRKKQGGIFADETGALPKSFERDQEKNITQRVQKLVKEGKLENQGPGAPIQKDSAFQKAIDDAVKNSSSKLDNLANSKLGTQQVSTIASFGKNPVGFMTSMFGSKLPILGALITAKELVQFFIVELMKPGGPLDINVRDIISNRINAFNDKRESAEILAGFTQVIFTTRGGTTSPRNAYNTFEVFNQDEEALADDFSIRVQKVN